MRADPVDDANRSEEDGRRRGGVDDAGRRPRAGRPGRCRRAAAGRRAAGLLGGHRVDRAALAGPLTRRERLRDPDPRPAAGWRSRRAKRGATRATVRKLKRGTAYEARVRACRRKRCAPWGRSVSSATLLAPINGPHPDPGCPTFPAGDEFNRDVSTADVAPNSDEIIARINADGGDALHPDFGSNPRYGIPYVVVPAAQPAVPIHFGPYGDESDRGPYPLPPGAPVEGGSGSTGDRHVLVVRRPAEPGGACDLFELYRAFERGDRDNGWRADSGARFDLGSPLAGQRPDGWTSADAAGLPIYPGLVTYEEVRSGVIDHAIRITFDETRRGYLSPATHYASDSCSPNRPPMGLRLRLEARLRHLRLQR